MSHLQRGGWTKAIIAGFAMLSVVRCSGSGSSSSTGSSGTGGPSGLVGCDAGASWFGTPCNLSISLEGGLSGTFSDFSGCGSSLTSLSWSNFSPIGPSSGISVSFSFPGVEPPIDQLGTFPLNSVAVRQIGGDGGTLSWRAVAGCSAQIDGSVCAPTSVFEHRRVLSGTVTCTQPLAPEAGNTGAPITITNFEFTGFINPR